VLDEAVAVARSQREQLVDVEPVPIGEETVDSAHADDARPGVCAGARRPGADLPEALDRDGRALERAAKMGERCVGGRRDAVTGGEVVHAEARMRPCPQRHGVLVALEEIGGKRPHVRAGQERVPVRLERAPVCGEHRSSIAAGEADPGLGARAG
jgi:hypothetical protein